MVSVEIRLFKWLYFGFRYLGFKSVSVAHHIRHLKNRHREVYEDFRAGKEICKLEPDPEPESAPRSDAGFSAEEGGEERDEAADPDYAPGNGSLNQRWVKIMIFDQIQDYLIYLDIDHFR